MDKLTQLEEKVLEQLVNELSYSEIAKQQSLSQRSVKSIIKQIMQKVGATNLYALVKFAIHKK